jgi:ABC-type dipeptide/oligopeptide/nickel transport system permease subunit
MNWKDTLRRAWKTAVQVGMSVLTVEVVRAAVLAHDVEPFIDAAFVAGAAAYSILHNAILTWAGKDA